MWLREDNRKLIVEAIKLISRNENVKLSPPSIYLKSNVFNAFEHLIEIKCKRKLATYM